MTKASYRLTGTVEMIYLIYFIQAVYLYISECVCVVHTTVVCFSFSVQLLLFVCLFFLISFLHSLCTCIFVRIFVCYVLLCFVLFCFCCFACFSSSSFLCNSLL